VETRVVAELCPQLPLEPLSRPIPHETTQVHRDHLVHCFRLAVGLRVECRKQMELDTDHREQLHPKFAGEDGILIAHNGARDPMEPHDVVEEGPCNGRRCIGVPKRDEVGVLQKPVDHRQDDRLAIDVGKSLHKIHGDVSPHRVRYVQWLQKTDRVQLFGLVPPARLTSAHKLRHLSTRA
jgi:hypothetical protein